jgi:hypothetical protein
MVTLISTDIFAAGGKRNRKYDNNRRFTGNGEPFLLFEKFTIHSREFTQEPIALLV